ncbi:MAG TPA: ATP-binding protein [Kineosporiaceae bacterium]|nr:ATP-binding protein [Kineosporiaceae bacterium]
MIRPRRLLRALGARRSLRLSRAAWATTGLALTLGILATLSTWTAIDATRSATRTSQELEIAQAYESILGAVYSEHDAQLRYLESPYAADPSAHATADRLSYLAARVWLNTAINNVRAVGRQSDRDLASHVLIEDDRYAATAAQLFDLVDAKQIEEARTLDREQTSPAVNTLLGLVSAAATTHRHLASEEIKRLAFRNGRTAALVPAVFGLAFVLLGGCWALLLTLQRDLRRQASALSEEKALLSSVISSSPHLVYWKDIAGRYCGFNQAFVDLRCGTGHLDLLGRTDAEIGASDPLPVALVDLERDVLATNVAVLDRHVTVAGPDGRPRGLLLSVLPKESGGGSIDGIIGVGADISHVSELERQLAQASRLEAIGQLAAGIAHEINTPIQFISHNTQFVTDSLHSVIEGLQGMSQLAQSEEVTLVALRTAIGSLDLDFLIDEVPTALADSQDGLRRVAEIVSAMKDFSHPGQERTDTDLNRAIRSSVEVSRAEWRPVAELELELDPEIGLVPCYEGELRQALVNIVVNAAQAIGAQRQPAQMGGLGHILVTSSRLEDVVHIVIADNGPGMDEAVRSRVFDPFFTTKPVGQGTGQGLSLTYATILKHGGNIEVSSEPGIGTSFLLTLPLQIVPDPPEPP